MRPEYPVIVIAGPTGTGKSDAAQSLSLALGGEVISADALAIYRGMDIGTAKVPPDERLVPHHMLDVAEPADGYDVAQFQQAARAIVESLHIKAVLPVVTGGTGLFIDALLYPMDFSSASGDEAVRQKWHDFLHLHGPERLHRELALRDESAAARLSANDTRRVIRALEVFELTGRPMTETRVDYRQSPVYDALFLVLTMNRNVLYKRVEARVDAMMRKGLLGEVRGLLDQGLSADSQAMQAIGYKELCGHILRGETLADCVAAIKQATRRYAKRQMTWFNRHPHAQLVNIDGFPSQAALHEHLLTIAQAFLRGDPHEA